MNIFIDFDGTLIDIKDRHHRVYKLCCEDAGGSPLGIDEYWAKKRDGASWDEILRLSNIPLVHETLFLDRFIERIESPVQLAEDQLFVGVKDTLSELRRSNTLFLLSLRRRPELLEDQIEKLGIGQFFSQILSGHSDTKEGSLSKKSDIIGALQLPHEGVVVIGDTEADIVAAKSIGAISVGVLSGIRSRNFLLRLNPNYLLDEITEAVKLFR